MDVGDSKISLSKLLPFNFCFCSSRTGTIVIAWLQEVLSIILIVVLGLHLLHLKLQHRVLHSSVTMNICIITILIFMFINTLLGGLLLCGAYQENRKSTGIYIYLKVVYLLNGFVSVLFFGIKLNVDHNYGGTAVLTTGIFILGLEIYGWFIAFSYYHHMKSSNLPDTEALVT